MSSMEVGVPGTDWRKARRSVNNGACVELASAHARVLVRDSTNRLGTVLSYSADDWRAFLVTAKANDLDMLR